MALTVLGSIARGFLMGSADVVPGVSGGTVAVVLGIYPRLIASVKAGSSALGRFARGDMAAGFEWLRRVEWLFLAPLLFGILLAIAVLASVIETQLEEHPVEVAALFLGLVASSIVVAWRLITRREVLELSTIAVVGVAVFLLLGLREGTSEDTVSQAADPALLGVFLAGSVAICAMILPGISGSLILVMLGMYTPILDAVTDRDAAILGTFLVGATIGLALFSQLLYRALARFYDLTMAALIGLMLGSTRVLWPWPHGLDGTELGTPEGSVAPAVALALVGFTGVLAINAIALRLSEAR